MKTLSQSGLDNLGSTASFLAIGIVSVIIRFSVRCTTRLPITWSDALIVLALASFIVYAALMIQYILAGPGPGTLDLNEIIANYTTGGQVWGVALLKMLYVSDIFFGLTITFAKISILALYYNIFSISKKFQLWTYAVGAVCVVWFLIYTFLNIFQCNPISALWDTLGSTEFCLPSGKLWLGYELPNLFLDVIILALPVTMLRHLHLPPAKKWSVAVIFLLGGLVCVASIVRTTYIWHPATPEVVDVAHTQILSSIQLGTAILCACLPTYGPLLRLFRGKVSRAMTAMGLSALSTTSKTNRSSASATAGLTGKSDRQGNFANSSYYRMDDVEQQTKITRGDGSAISLGDLPSNSIVVHNSVRVS